MLPGGYLSRRNENCVRLVPSGVGKCARISGGSACTRHFVSTFLERPWLFAEVGNSYDLCLDRRSFGRITDALARTGWAISWGADSLQPQSAGDDFQIKRTACCGLWIFWSHVG